MSDFVYQYLRPEHFEPASSANAWLGRIVEDHSTPDAGSTPKDSSRFFIEPPKESTIDDVRYDLTGNSDKKLFAQIPGIASASRTSNTTTTLKLSASSVRRLRLPQHRDVFEEMRNDPEVRSHLKRMLIPGGKPAYMIVALLIGVDIEFSETIAHCKDITGVGTIPLSTIASVVAGSPIPVADPKGGRSMSTSASKKMEGKIKGSNIFALEYKTVRRRAYSLFANFTPRLDDHGPRVEGGRNLGSGKTPDEPGAQSEENLYFEMDEDDVLWIETLEDTPEVVEFSDFGLVFGN